MNLLKFIEIGLNNLFKLDLKKDKFQFWLQKGRNNAQRIKSRKVTVDHLALIEKWVGNQFFFLLHYSRLVNHSILNLPFSVRVVLLVMCPIQP